jgi:hypothetical protein
VIKRFSDFIKESIDSFENEIFSAYNGRYLFDVTKAYQFAKDNPDKARIETYPSFYLSQYSHPDFSLVDPKKISKIRKEMDYDKPLGLLVRFKNPEDPRTEGEWVLIDGNHRTRIAVEENMPGKLMVIKDPNDVETFMKFDPEIPHELFPEDY